MHAGDRPPMDFTGLRVAMRFDKGQRVYRGAPMTPVGKFVKILLAIAAAGLIVGSQACKKEAPAPAREASTSKAAVTPPKAPGQPWTVDMKVTENGYEPSPIVLKKGEPVTLRITRTTDQTCATEIIIPGYGIETKLPLNETVEVNFTPKESGELKYGCAMGQMISGVFTIE